MKVFPIKSPLQGEQVVGVEPSMDRFSERDWRQRVNNFTGRSLTHTALRTEQAGRSGRVTSLGQMLSPGVINGLEADKLILGTGAGDQEFIEIAPGLSLDDNGEIITLTAPLQAQIRDIPVYAPASILGGSGPGGDGGGELAARRLGPELGQLISAGADLPRVAVLVLQAVQVEMRLDQEDDPCELDPEAYAYENWQLVDGARLVLYSWPEEVISLPAQPHQAMARNAIANSIFAYEKNLPAGESLPWSQLGTAVGLIGFSDDWSETLFVDRHAVVRNGGKRRRAAAVLPAVGNRFMWQARFQQFNEQLAEFVTRLEAGEDVIARSAAQFRYLPPVGVLPKGFVDLQDNQQKFFPLSYNVEALAMPYEQLDVVIQESAALEAFDFNRADRIQVLVPVPQIYYEPELLVTELIDPEFDQTISRFVGGRNDWLGRRLEIRRKASTLNLAIRGEALEFEQPDPEAVDSTELAAPFETALVEAGDTWSYLKGVSAPPSGWETGAFDDSGWSTGSSGLGYNSASAETQLDDMTGNYLSVFCRKTFNLDTLDAARNYRLEILTNGGFFAYLNGTEIESDNLSAKTFNASADKGLEPEVVSFDLGNLSSGLTTGANLLAFQVHSAEIAAKSFIFLPRLVEKQYVEDIESEGYDVTVKTDSSDNPLLNDAEPDYEIAALQELKTFFDARTYDEKDEAGNITSKRIWSSDEIDKFDKVADEGLQEFIEFLQAKVNSANDKIDYGFVRLQTDIYRIRQFVLGNEAATKLATSPVLASIAQGQTAVATREDITRIASLLSQGSGVSTQFSEDTSGGKDEPISKSFTPQSRGGADTFIAGGFDDFGIVSGGLGDSKVTSDLQSSKGSPLVFPESSKEKTVLDLESSGGGELFGGKTPTTKDIEEQSSIIGTYPTFRNVTVGERLQEPVSRDAENAGRATRTETIVNIGATGLSMDGIIVPGFIELDGEGKQVETTKPFNTIKDAELADIRDGKHDYDAADNEAAHFNSGVRSLENASALLRLVEGRVKTYKVMIERCRSTLARLSTTRKQMDKRLKLIEDELAEARHDVSVSRALKAEEQSRIDGINEHRAAILEEQVPFLVFRRPRLSDLIINTPSYELRPDLSDAPLPLCDIDPDETPEEISAMMEVIREAPLNWFKLSSRLTKRINRHSDLQLMLKSARLRANSRTTRHRLLGEGNFGLNLLAQGINKTLLASNQRILLQRKKTAAIDLASFGRLGWEEGRKRASEVISLGDLIDGNHGRPGASKLAAAELDQISNVAVCLYLQFVQVLPSIRLDWAERLSQYDAPFNLRNLYSLPRWREIEYIERNEMQRLVDWLYARINAVYSDAADMISELIRICILLASHAPVNKLVSGLVPEPVTVKVGSKIDVVADLTRVRIGMNIAMVSGRKTVARGRVADIVGGRVQAQIVSTVSSSVFVEKNAKVQIAEPRATGGMAYQQNRFLFKR
jgi:hypothetical protein